MSNVSHRGPRPLSEILGDLFTVRGYGRLLARQELEDAWNRAVGEPCCRQTRLGEVRRGVLNVTVAHSTLLEELAAFRKLALLEAMRIGAPGTPIRDIRFRVGPLVLDVEAGQTADSGAQAGRGKARVTGSDIPPGRTKAVGRRNASRSSGSNQIEP